MATQNISCGIHQSKAIVFVSQVCALPLAFVCEMSCASATVQLAAEGEGVIGVISDRYGRGNVLLDTD